MDDIAFRYYCTRDEGGDPIVAMREYRILSYTPKGFYIEARNKKGKRRVNHSPGCRGYCHKEKEKALEHFKVRTKKYIKILGGRLQNARDCLLIAKSYGDEIIDELTETHLAINESGEKIWM